MWFRSRKLLIAAGAAAPPLLILAAALADPPVTVNLSNGAALSVEIQQPSHDQEFRVPVGTSTINLGVSGDASIGKGQPDATIIYVIDRSGSTASGSGTGCSPILGCEKQFFSALNAAAVSDGSTDLAAVVSYSDGATIDQSLIDPTNPAVTNAINGLGASGSTNCTDGLVKAQAVASSGANTNGTTIVVFASDGLCNAGGSVATAANALGATGAIVYSVAVGSGSDCTSNGGTGTLNQIPKNGGTCTEVPDPGNLPNIIQNLIGSTLESLSIEHETDSSPIAETSLPLPQPGSVSITFGPTALLGLAPGTQQFCVTAAGSDVLGGSTSATDCHQVQLLQLTASPATATNNLNFVNSHTVTANIVGGTGPARNVQFTVGGKNAASASPGSGGVPATPNDPVSFSYSVPKDCASLGTDTINVETQIGGESDSITLSKTWIDDVAPNVACDPTTNPAGKKVPPANNEDGFFQLNANDPNLANCTVTLTVTDGTGFVFPGPFTPGIKIKYTQAPGAPQSQKKIGSDSDAVIYHLTGKGDLTVTGTDPSGNSKTVVCLVPPPPK